MTRKLATYIMIALSFLLTVTAIVGGAYFRVGTSTYDLALFQPSPAQIFAPWRALDFVATEENRQRALQAAQDRYERDPPRDFDNSVWFNVQSSIETRFNEIHLIRIAYHEEIEYIAQARADWQEWYAQQTTDAQTTQTNWEAALQAYIAQGGYEENFSPRPPDFAPEPWQLWSEPDITALAHFDALPLFFREDMRVHLIRISDYELSQLRGLTLAASHSAHMGGIRELELEGEIALATGAIDRYLSEHAPDRISHDIASLIALRHLQPNHLINHEENARRRAEDEANYEEVFVQEGEIIVSEGHIITERVYHLLTYFGYAGVDSDLRSFFREEALPLLGMILLSAALFVSSLMYLYFYRPTIITTQKEAPLLFVLYVMLLVVLWVMRDQPYQFLPILIFPMLVSVLIDRRCAVMLSMSVVLIGYFVTDGSLEYLLFYAVTGTLVCLLSRYTTQRSKIILVGFLVTAIAFALSLAIAFTLERTFMTGAWQSHLVTAAFAAMNGLLVVIFSVGTLPFWEAFFGVVTPVKLLDLTNPTNALLRRLTIEAPGTYHHSLMVANLAESAAFDIDANSHAARVGGYYHDIGKLRFPHFFAENMSGENPHDHLDPVNSANLILTHVTHGLTLAAQHRLPQFVRDIIREHHGTSLIKVFYVKAKEADPEVTEDDFRYPFTVPQTRESACVMLADTVEAAVRSMMPKMKSPDEIDDAIRNLIRAKLNDGQLADSQLSIKDLEVIVSSFARVLRSAHHERIAYPKLESETAVADEPAVLIRGMVRKEP